MKQDKIQLISTVLIGILAGGVLLVVLMKHVLPVILPFLIAWFVAFAVRAPAKRLSKITRLSERITRPILAILITLLAFGAIALLLWQLVTAAWETLAEIGEGNNPVYGLLTALSDGKSLFGDGIPEELAEQISDAIGGMLTSILSGLAGAVTSWVGVVPNALLFLLVTVISLIYFAIDLEKINTRVRRLLPEGVGGWLSLARRRLFSVAKKYAGSYLVILLITFATMTLGFLILGVENALVIATVVAILDLLPVIGVGTVLIPWSIVALLSGDSFTGVGLILLFLINTVIRELCEPRIIGKNLGLHPILSLILIYAGYGLFGITGLLITPLIAMLLGFLFDKENTPKVAKPTRPE